MNPNDPLFATFHASRETDNARDLAFARRDAAHARGFPRRALLLVTDGHAPIVLAVTTVIAPLFQQSGPAETDGARRVRLAAAWAPKAHGFWIVEVDTPATFRRAEPSDLADVAYEHGWWDVAGRAPLCPVLPESAP